MTVSIVAWSSSIFPAVGITKFGPRQTIWALNQFNITAQAWRRKTCGGCGVGRTVMIMVRLARRRSMSVPRKLQLLSVEEYLEAEKDSPVRHEYIDGQIYAM